MSRRAHTVPMPVEGRPGLVWPMRIDETGAGGPTEKQARGPGWTRVGHGLYVPTGLDPDLAVEQRIVNAAYGVGTGGAVTGWAALRWRGAGWLDCPQVDLSVMRGVTAGVVEVVHGVRVAAPLDAACVAACRAPTLAKAVGFLDRAAAVDLMSLAEVRDALVTTYAGRRGVRQARLAVELASENSWSPTETSMRLLWRGLGLTSVVCNQPIFDSAGRHLGTPDLLDLDHGVVGEYDGADHLTGARRAADIRREGAFRRAGLEYVEMVAADLRDPSDFRRRTRDAVRRSAVGGRRRSVDGRSPVVVDIDRHRGPTAGASGVPANAVVGVAAAGTTTPRWLKPPFAAPEKGGLSDLGEVRFNTC